MGKQLLQRIPTQARVLDTRSRAELASEVEQRNKLRTEFGMATVPVSAEVEKLYSAALRKAFRDWSETYPHRAEIEAEVLQIIREEKRDPHWLPIGLLNGALWFGHLVRKRLQSDLAAGDAEL